jgi:hypothetical protein
MNCPNCTWAMLPPRCQNPDCKKGNKNARPAFRPPMRTQRGHGAGGRVRAYRGAEDTTLDDVDEQGPLMAYLDRYVPGWEAKTQRQRDVIRARVHQWLVSLYEAEHGDGSVEMGQYGDLDRVGPPPKEVTTL